MEWNGQSLKLTIPADPDSLLDLPEVQQENSLNDYMPYWGYLWPAARSMAGLVAAADWKAGTTVLELGCGSGLIGLAALARGMQVTFSDNRQEALDLAGYNARQNQFSNFQGVLLDWLNPQQITAHERVIASDILYEQKFHEPLLELIPRLVTRTGEIWIGDPGRSFMLDFVRLSQQWGWQVEIFDEQGQPCSFPQLGRFHLLVFRR